jgi:excisionase family DNA binding protein
MSGKQSDDAPVRLNLESLWTVAEVASFLRVSRSWVYHRCEMGDLPCLRIGALVRFDPEQIRAFARGERPSPAKVIPLRSR